MECKSGRRCGKFRTCERCAAIRSARIANMAEKMQKNHGSLAYAVLTGERQQDILREMKRVTEAGIWTIEVGEIYGGLHTNLIVPFDGELNDRGGVFIERIRGSVRSVAAYMSKQGAMPSKQAYSGRILGAWGSAIGHVLSSDAAGHEVARAAAANMFLINAGGGGRLPERKSDEQKKAESREQYREIAYRHLADLRAAVRR